MYPLKRISEDLIQFAETIKSIIGAEVLIVDEDFVRLVSTETSRQYAKIDSESVFAHALKNNTPFLIDSPREDDRCMGCTDRDQCSEFALACAPITFDNKVVGVIGLIAFTELQKQALLLKRNELLHFLSHIGQLIAIKLVEREKTAHLEMMAKELHFIFEAIEKPMMTCDASGKILRYNQAALHYFKSENALRVGALQLFHLSQKLLNQPIPKILRYVIDSDGNQLIGTYRRYKIEGVPEPQVVFLLEDSKSILGMYRAVVSDSVRIKFDQLVGTHPAFIDAIERSKRCAQTDLSVLLLGESGTGKELFARSIHEASDRQLLPFIAINCAAIPENLLEAELFGYEEGAFTGAAKGGRAGRFEMAHGGTLFLDEIGDMPLSLQAKLLRVLQDGYITRVGSHIELHVDVRIISATHQNLQEKMQQGLFRKDLYYRISTYPITLPALRERKTDIPQLVQFFMHKYQREYSSGSLEIAPEVMQILMQNNWEGNVRELENVVAYALSYCSSHCITAQDLPVNLSSVIQVHPSSMDKDQLFQDAVNRYGTTGASVQHIGQALGISRATVYRRLKRLK